MDDLINCIIISILCTAVAVVGYFIGGAQAFEEGRRAAIEHNAAEYTVNPKDGKVTFQWKTSTPP